MEVLNQYFSDLSLTVPCHILPPSPTTPPDDFNSSIQNSYFWCQIQLMPITTKGHYHLGGQIESIQ